MSRKRTGKWPQRKPLSHLPIFQFSEPAQTTCCLCQRRFTRSRPRYKRERRRTGLNLKLQFWPYCQPCWDASAPNEQLQANKRFSAYFQRKFIETT